MEDETLIVIGGIIAHLVWVVGMGILSVYSILHDPNFGLMVTVISILGISVLNRLISFFELNRSINVCA